MTGGIIEAMPVDDSPAGRAFITQDMITAVTDDAAHVDVSISVRAERLGVLDVVLREPPDADALDTLSQVVIVLGTCCRLRTTTPTSWSGRGGSGRWSSRRRCSGRCGRSGRTAAISSAWAGSWSRRARSAATCSTTRPAPTSCSSR
jgi:hypothetical protein